MGASDSDNFAGFEGKFGFLVAALPVGAFFANKERVTGTLLHGERPGFLRTIGPLVDSFESVYNRDLHIVPVVLVVIIAVNNVVTEEALFEKLSWLSSGSGLGSRSFAARSRATSNFVDFAMRSSDSDNSTSFIGELGFFVAALPIRAFFANEERVFGALLQSECPRDFGTVCPLVDSSSGIYNSDLHIVPVVLVVLIAVNDEVTKEAHFVDLDGGSSSGLGSRSFATVAASNSVDFAMRSSDSHNSISFISELGFLVAALPVGAFFADDERVSGAWPQRECPRDLSTICPLVDSFVGVYDSDLHIVPVVLVVLIAVNDEVTEEAHFMDRLGRSRFGSRLGRSRFAVATSAAAAGVFASAASIMRLPFFGIITRPRELALSAALGLTTVLISQGSAVLTPVQLVAFQCADYVLASAASFLGLPLFTVPLGPRPTADTAVWVLLVTAVLVCGSVALVAPVKLVVLVVADYILASAARVLGLPFITVSLGPGPAADTTVGAMTTVLISRFVALVAPAKLMRLEFKDVLLASTEGILGLPLCAVPSGPRPAADTAVLHLTTVLIRVALALVTPVEIFPREGVNVGLAAASGLR